MRRLLFVLSLGLAACASATPPVLAEAVTACSRAEPSGERTLCHEAVIAAPIGDVWALWSTSEGLASWVAPVAAIDLRIGGMFESSYDANARLGDAGNIRNRIVTFEPEALLVLQVAAAPPGFPHADEVRQLATLVELLPVDATHTRVRVSMLGYRDGAAFDALYRHFDRGNGWTLSQLQERVARGPTDWRAAAEASR